MGFFFSLLGMAAMTALGLYGYGKLRDLEMHIRTDLGEAGKGKEPPLEKREEPAVRKAKVEKIIPEEREETKEGSSDVPESSPLEQQILEEVSRRPGILQSDLYEYLPAIERRALQKILLDMDRQGKLRREKEKSSYRLFVGKG